MRITFSSLCLVLLLSLLHQNPTVGADLIDQTCSASNVLYKDLCLATLRPDPASQSADIHGLAKIALAATSADLDTVTEKIDQLLESGPSEEDMGPLKDCKETYGSARDQVSESDAAMSQKRYGDVNVYISASMTDADTCESGFKPGRSKLTEANQKFSHLCSNVLAISIQAANS